MCARICPWERLCDRFDEYVQVVLPGTESGFEEPPSGHQGFDSRLHCADGHAQRGCHVRKRGKRLALPIGATAEVGVHGKIPFIQVECFYRQLAPCAGQLQELVLIGDPAAIPILPGRHYQQALLFQTGHGGADRVLAQTAPLLYGGVTDGRCAQAVLAVR